MQEPKKTPLNPNTPRTKKINQIPMPSLYAETIHNDITKEDLNSSLDENENTSQSN